MWFISKQIKPKKSWTVSDASHFLLEKISEAHKMSPALTIYQVILIYGSQWAVRNGGERWRAYNIYFFSRTVYQRAFFFPFIHNSGTASPPPCFRKKKGKNERGKKICILVLYYVLQAASSLCQLSVGVQPFLRNMLYLLSSCVCDITELLLWRTMNGAIMRGRQIIKILRRVGC